jgi:hypothetical protein
MSFRRLVAAASWAVFGVVGCSSSDSPSSAAGSASAVATGLPPSMREAWANHVRVTLTIQDTTDELRYMETCLNGHFIGGCASGNPRRKPVQLSDAATDAMKSLMICTTDYLLRRPERYLAATMPLTVGDSGKVEIGPATQEVELVELRALEACRLEAATALATSTEKAGSYTVTLTYWYERFCEDAVEKGGGEKDTFIRVKDVKNVPTWILIPTASGYQLADCRSPDQWSIENTLTGVYAKNAKGERVASVEKSLGGFEVRDAASRVLRRGRSTPSWIEIENADGKKLGWIGRSAPDNEPSGLSHWEGDMYHVDPPAKPDWGKAALSDYSLDDPTTAALFLFLRLNGSTLLSEPPK